MRERMKMTVKPLTVQVVEFVVDGQHVGGADIEVQGDEVWCNNFAITPEFRGKGYAQQALKMLIERFGVNTRTCAVYKEAALHIYEKFGFRIVDEGMHDYDGKSYLLKRIVGKREG